MLKANRGRIPERAQSGLSPALAEQGYFLACVCEPVEDMEVALPGGALARHRATVSAMARLNADVLGITLRPDKAFPYRAGQFINLYKDDMTVRSYSLASVPQLDEGLHLQVRRVPGGVVSNWLFEEVRVGDVLEISEATGDCFYTAGKPQQNLLLIGTGTGLAPLYGIIRDALRQGHTGRIELYHGAYSADALYKVEELRQLAQSQRGFSYVPCVSGPDAPPGFRSGMVLDVAMAEHPSLAGWRVFLCGHPEMVGSARMKTFLAGASMSEIHADPFN
jgi:ferredoxin-NADP reductase